MPEGCPPPSLLEAVAAATVPEGDRDAVGAHVESCSTCARRLDERTRADLDGLGVRHLASDASSSAAGEAVADLIRRARMRDWNTPRNIESRVLSALDPPSSPGTLGSFAGYEVIEVAGQGAMGVVLKARDSTLNRLVALKVLAFKDDGTDEDAATAFLNEARSVAAIRHDHVVEIHAAGREKGLPFLVMPFHVEGSLEAWLEGSPRYSVAETTRIGRQLAMALEATHARGVVHRDLKPSNVLLDRGIRHLRLADFGLAQSVAGGSTRHGGPIAGTPRYLSPEQARGERADGRSDLFGLGALLYEVATGRVPRQGATVEEVLRAAACEPLPPVRDSNPSVPPALARIVDRLLAPRPEDRFATAGEVVSALDDFERRFRGTRRTRATLQWGTAAFLLFAAAITLLDRSGQTAIVNAWLCRIRGDGYYVRGQFGTYANLADAVEARRTHDVVEARFEGPRPTTGFRVGEQALTVRAARGFSPVLVATNRFDPLILADGPLSLEGLTLVNAAEGAEGRLLILVENAPLHLLNCRLVRSASGGDDLLVRAGRRVPPDDDLRTYRPLVSLTAGSLLRLGNCLVLGVDATGIGLRGGAEPIRIEIGNSLFVSHRTFALRPDAVATAEIDARESVFATGTLLDLWNAPAIGDLAVSLRDCVVDRTGGMLLRWNRGQGKTWLQALAWSETNTIYAGIGRFAADRRHREAEAEVPWHRDLVRSTDGHRVTGRGVFDHVLHRSVRRLEAVDVDLAGAGAATGLEPRWNPLRIGEGEPYRRMRSDPAYWDWQRRVDGAAQAWYVRREGVSRAP